MEFVCLPGKLGQEIPPWLRGTLPQDMGYPLARTRGTPPDRRESACYVAGSMPLVVSRRRMILLCTIFRKQDQKIRVILGRSQNTFHIVQWLSMRKQILKHKKIKKTHITGIILHNYILYNDDLTSIGTFLVNLRMALIFTDFPTRSGSSACAVLCWKSVNIVPIPESTGKVSM